jgi:hypothetical protein
MRAFLNEDGTAGGSYSGVDELVEQVANYEYDALAIQTPISCDEVISEKYFASNGTMCNPWGRVEAITSHVIADKINKPVAHAPAESVDDYSNTYLKKVVYMQMAPEIVSKCFTFCVIKGLHRAPKLILDTSIQHPDIMTKNDIDFLLTPDGCWGRPHDAAATAGIPIIVVEENTSCLSANFKYPTEKGLIFVKNYIEAAGLIMSMSAGVDYHTILLNGKF